MKVLYIESKRKNSYLNLTKENLEKLPRTLFLVYTIQYLEQAKLLKKQLQENNIKITGFQQVLGCSNIKTKDPILLIGSGKFHAINLINHSPRIFVFEDNNILEIPNKDIETLKIRQKTALIKFLSAKSIGILISTKPGQENINLAIKLKNKLEKKDKNVFLFISNNVQTNEFENFNIDSWINTACSGLALDNSNIVNFKDIPN